MNIYPEHDCMNSGSIESNDIFSHKFHITVQQEPNTFLFDFIVFCKIMFFSLLLSSCFVSHFVYMPLKNMNNNNSNPENDKDKGERVCYIDKYPLENAVHNETKRVNHNSFVTEMTPYGYVIMRYDYDREAFMYWSDKNIPFDILEVVARKFVSLYQCSNLYIERTHLKKKVKEDDSDSETEKKDTQDTQDTQEKDKTENKTEKEPTEETKEKKQEEISPFAQLKSKNNQHTRKPKEEKRACKFIRIGKICDFQVLQSIELESPTDKLDFSTFKKIYQSMSETETQTSHMETENETENDTS